MLAPGTVVDADPRTISNLIADQTLNNPAAISAALTYAGITGAAQMTAISQIQAARARRSCRPSQAPVQLLSSLPLSRRPLMRPRPSWLRPRQT